MAKNKKWERVIVETPSGPQEAVAPVIISASRATDIPAFHLPWLVERISTGWIAWRNPFNATQQIVSFARARAIIFWTKNARPLLKYLEKFSEFSFYVHFTLNNYELEGLEPGLPELKSRIETFIDLSRKIGRHRVIWRFDPMLLLPELTVQDLLTRVAKIGNILHPWTEKLVFSLADIDIYPAVARRMKRMKYKPLDWTKEQIEQLASGLARLAEGWGIQVATCAENIDLSSFGIKPNRCIDDELLHKAFPNDRLLQEFLGYTDECDNQGSFLSAPLIVPSRPSLKDRGQRKYCGCIISKDIGRYGTCSHGCVYCYANPY